jgi:hypothetical protein
VVRNLNSSEELSLKEVRNNLDNVFRTLIVIATILIILTVTCATRTRALAPTDLKFRYFLFIAIVTWCIGTITRREYIRFYLKVIGWYHLILGLLLSFTLYLTFDYSPTRGENLLMMGIILFADTVMLLALIRHINYPKYSFMASIFVILMSAYTFVTLFILI